MPPPLPLRASSIAIKRKSANGHAGEGMYKTQMVLPDGKTQTLESDQAIRRSYEGRTEPRS